MKKKPKWELSFSRGICIGIEEVISRRSGKYSKMVLNTILPETDEEYEEQKKDIEGTMQLICDLYNKHNNL